MIDTVPWRHEHWKRTTAKELHQPRAAGRQFKTNLAGRAGGGKFALLLAGGGVVRMTPPVLKDSEAWSGLGQPNREVRSSICRDHCKSDRDFLRNRDQAVETWARHYRIVIPPPQRCRPFRRFPAVQLVEQTRPSRGYIVANARRLVHEGIISPVRRTGNPSPRTYSRSPEVGSAQQ